MQGVELLQRHVYNKFYTILFIRRTREREKVSYISFIVQDMRFQTVSKNSFSDTLTGEIKYSCNGVIVNERTVLTTATCALAKSDRYKLYVYSSRK